MTRRLDITDSQKDSADRWDIHGAVYLLSGALVGRDSVPDASIYWSTRSLTALGQNFKAYMGPPQQITRAMGFEPGAPGSFPEIRIPVRNLPFAHSESLVAAITDDDFRWENTDATLRVAYLRPGQDPEDLVDADWTPLVLNGFLGPPDEVTLDGFVLPLYNRGARRNQSIVWPQLPSLETMSGGAMDTKDMGTMPPVIVGNPRDWVRVPSLNLGVRGFTSSGYNAGDTTVTFRTITGGPENLLSGEWREDLSAFLQIHNLYPIYRVTSGTFDEDTKEFTVTLASGLVNIVPRGGYVQQFGPGINPNTGLPLATEPSVLDPLYLYKTWSWALGAPLFAAEVPQGTLAVPQAGWLFADGEVRPADPEVWPLLFEAVFEDVDVGTLNWFSLSGEGGRNLGDVPRVLSGSHAVPGQYTNGFVVSLLRETSELAPPGMIVPGGRIPSAPVYFDPVAALQDVSVATQPEFESLVTALSVINLPTGASATGGDDTFGNDPDNVIDGADISWYQVDDGHTLTITFPSAAAPFANSDTTRSVLHIKVNYIADGGIKISAPSFVEVADISTPFNMGTAAPVEFMFVMGNWKDFNQSITIRSFDSFSGVGRITDVWWEHDLAANVPQTRTQDVTLSTTEGVLVGPVLQFAELVIRAPDCGSALTRLMISGGQARVQPSGQYGERETPVSGVAYPTSVMTGLHALLGAVEGDVSTINQSSYAAAHQRFIEENIRLGFVWDEKNRPKDWTELESMVGEQTRSYMFYGVSGHEILFLENDYDAFPVLQTFRLPGCPGANTIGAGQPLFARTLITELTNQYSLQWNPDPITNEFRGAVVARNEESIADIGVRNRDGGDAKFTLYTPWDGNPNYTVAESVSGIAQFNADRHAFAKTRFTFNTAWIAHGLDRGSVIRIMYAVSSSPLSLRSVTAEVESVSVSPIDGDKFMIIARSVSKPQKITSASTGGGTGANYTWAEVFTSDDEWTDEVQQDFDTWADFWSTR